MRSKLWNKIHIILPFTAKYLIFDHDIVQFQALAP